MKELSVEQKAKAYDEAIKKAESLYKVSEPMSGCNVIIETLFPELKESEDERIRKEMIFYFQEEIPQCSIQEHSDKMREFISWLKRQEIECIKLELKAGNSYFCYKSRWERADNETFKKGLIYKCNKDGVLDNFVIKNPEQHFIEIKDERIAWLEKLKVFAEHGDGLYYFGNNGFTYVGNPTCDNVLWIEKQGEQKPASKVKPKFKADDFILNGDVTDDGKPEIFKVLNVQDTWYAVENIYDGRNTIITFKQDSSCRLWDLTKDAKDGAFLVCGKDKLPFIFKGLLDKFHPDCPVAYCGICEDGIFSVSSGDGWWTGEEVFPANKEQCEQLLKAIADAGYIWDAEKKELKEVDYHCTGVGKKEETGVLKKMLDLEMGMITPEESLGVDSETYSKIVDECIYGDEQKPTDEEMKRLLQTKYEKGRADAIAEQKPLSEEDERIILAISQLLKDCESENGWNCIYSNDREVFFADIENYLQLLKNRIVPQQKQEWSEEDENEYAHTLKTLNLVAEEQETKGYNNLISSVNWFKSLKDRIQPQSRWKPSDEQMDALNDVISSRDIKYDILSELWKDLKKLKGE